MSRTVIVVALITCATVLLLPSNLVAQVAIAMTEIEMADIPAEIQETANKAVPGVEWEEQYRHSRESDPNTIVWYRFVGQKVLRAQEERMTSDGDIDVIPGDVRSVEIRVRPDGTLVDIMYQIPPKELPQAVTDAIKAKNDLEPQYAWSIRKTADGEPTRFLVWLDVNGFIEYMASADGKKVDRIER